MHLIYRIGISTLISLAAIAALADNPPAPTTPPPLTTVVQNDEAENLLADRFNRTLYVFDLDQNQTSPMCNAACAELWPPYILTTAEVAGVKAPFGSIMRASQKAQLTYNGRPVYTYGFDRKEGDDQGDGIGNVWHYIELVVTPKPPAR